ncbi:hypothetical protein WR25_14348 [Diploscapter pachys]|uniref:Uncharacterized protein n=1 Tax=Diploscapter pachys TaxID=2018661 RepID=A0A2A2J311_9BILA|nr:hypothetical protein WR25_14348 [Diploscapter pachys]
MVYIGIDLGTTYSCVSVMQNGKPNAIHHDDGKNIVPSVVAYSSEILVGNPALDAPTDMSNILYDSKRLIGWEVLNNLPIAENRQLWTFKVDTRDNCAGYVLNKGTLNERFLKPEEVSAEILKYLKINAEKYLNEKVTGVVVTVPAFFQENQKAATRKAIELAGLELKGLLYEPNAAAIAYNAKNNLGNSKLLVFDFGGGTLDVSILVMSNGDPEVKAVTGEAHLEFGAIKQPKEEIEIPLINNTVNELARNINKLEIGEDNSSNNSNEILFYRPMPSEWRDEASVAYFKDRLYYLGGEDPKTKKDTNRVDLLMDGKVKKYIDYQTMSGNGLKSERFQKNDVLSELHR